MRAEDDELMREHKEKEKPDMDLLPAGRLLFYICMFNYTCVLYE
jgi:hypothetical protein